jgi:hypothetical protein
MKAKLFFLIITFGAFASCKDNVDNATLKIVLDRNTTKNDLAGIIEGVKAANINLRIDETEYNAKGGLEKIKGEVGLQDRGFATFSSEKVGRIIITQDLDTKDGGFSVEVRRRWF